MVWARALLSRLSASIQECAIGEFRGLETQFNSLVQTRFGDAALRSPGAGASHDTHHVATFLHDFRSIGLGGAPGGVPVLVRKGGRREAVDPVSGQAHASNADAWWPECALGESLMVVQMPGLASHSPARVAVCDRANELRVMYHSPNRSTADDCNCPRVARNDTESSDHVLVPLLTDDEDAFLRQHGSVLDAK